MIGEEKILICGSSYPFGKNYPELEKKEMQNYKRTSGKYATRGASAL